MNIRAAATWAGGILAAGFTASAIAWLVWLGVEQGRLEQIKSEIRAAGVPLAEADILPPILSDADNAAPMLRRSKALMKKLRADGSFVLPFSGSRSPKRDLFLFDDIQLARLRDQVAGPEVQEALTLAREASRMPGVQFERNYSQGPLMELGEINFLDEARLLGTSAWLQARDGDARGAAADLLACSQLGGLGFRDVILLGWLVGAATDAVSLNMSPMVLSALPRGEFRLEDWKPLLANWGQNGKNARNSLARALDGERILMGAWVFQDDVRRQISLGDGVFWSAGLENSQQTFSLRLALWAYEYPLRPLFLADHAAYLRLLFGLRQSVASPKSTRLEPSAHEKCIPRTAVLTRLTFPALGPAIARLEEYEVRVQIAGLGFALEDYRSRYGKYPHSLEALGLPQEATTDRFNGAQFLYRTEGDHVVLYSVGKNRIDDGAITAGQGKADDLVWRIQR